jgi:hypothetical protein
LTKLINLTIDGREITGLSPFVRVRLGLGYVPQDVELDARGHVIADGRGMSVAPGLRALRPEVVPRRLRHLREGAVGPDSNVVWSHGDGSFVEAPVAPHLVLKPDASDHGTVAPDGSMLLEEYRSALAATQNSWVRDER